jgi:glycosyltransferase involved in cell wall biosynthesis
MPPLELECVIPAYNEAADLAPNVERLLTFCAAELGGAFRITIAENGSTDDTAAIALDLARSRPCLGVLQVREKGRGEALRRAFLASEARWIGYMDADLSTHLEALPLALARLEAGADMVIGSRLTPGARTRRRLHREVLSRSYNALVRTLFRSPLRDHQCGFKFLSRQTCRDLVPMTRDRRWFFDTELLVLAGLGGRRIEEIPVNWIEDLGSTVQIARTVRDDLVGMWDLWRRMRAFR